MTPHRIAIWDWPVRLTHWGFALLLPAMWWTAENGEMGWHMRLGLVLLALVLFRIFWGFAGSRTARFTSFVRSPLAALRYLLGKEKDKGTAIGHNPAGAWSVLILLGALLAQISFGLFSGDPYDGATGPLNSLVGVLTADMLTDWHETFFWVLVGLVAMHLLAVFAYQVIGKQDLLVPMVTGSKAAAEDVQGNTEASWLPALVCLALASGIAFAISSGMVGRWFTG